MITFEEVLAAKPKMIYYGAQTPWWTHKAEHLNTTGEMELKFMPPPASRRARDNVKACLPCDPRGGMLMQTDKTEEFLEAAKAAALEGKYGRHGIHCFMAAHHENVSMPLDSWDEYSKMLDLAISTDKIQRERIKMGLCPYCERVMGLKDRASIWFCSICGVAYTDELKKQLQGD